jgi:PAS domain-containing protein
VRTHRHSPKKNLSASELQTRLVRFETAIERMSHGVCFFDGAQRLILANRRYAELYDLPSDSIQPGMSLRDITELRIRAGSCPQMTSDEYLVWRTEVATRTSPPRPSLRWRTRGRS